MRAIPNSLDAAVVAEIDRRLLSVGTGYSVRISWAIESGSRAWGFPSPDSDYDCRFIFVRPRDEYVALWSERDVIETPLDATFDVNGWDIAKAIKLIAKGNATAIEWLRSPIIYSGEAGFRDAMLSFAAEVVERSSIGRHYLHVGLQQKAATQNLKRFFYVMRPAMALRWLATHPEMVIPPMDLPTLLLESDVPPAVLRAAEDLISQKAVTRELGAGTPPEALEKFVTTELGAAEHFDADALNKDPRQTRDIANAFFRSQIEHT